MSRAHRRLVPVVLALVVLGLLPGGPAAEAGQRRPHGSDGARSRERFLAVLAETRPTPSLREQRAERPADDSRVPELAAGESLLVHLERSIPVTARPGGGRTIATMPATSRYYGEPLVAWVRRVQDGRFGLVSIPYVVGTPTGWIALRGLELSTTDIAVEADRSRHELVVRRDGEVILRAPAATGAASSPTPTGSYFVTDRVAFPRGGALGTYAFGISGIQPNLPPGWDGGDQLAIHGTNDPSSIGRSASAGCLRVSERVLDRLRPLLGLGTPVLIVP
jgi:lipoprotein-anchoring transpeptidase ErfK/SrfK